MHTAELFFKELCRMYGGTLWRDSTIVTFLWTLRLLFPPDRIASRPQPQDIVARLTQDPEEVAKRPLLAGDDPKAKLEALMEDRRPQYAQVLGRVA